MEIEIVQKKFIFQDRYDILVNKELVFKAFGVIFSFMPKIRILDLNQNEIGSVEKEFNFPKLNFPRYNLNFGTYSTIILNADSFTRYLLHIPKGTIEICEQKGRKLGIFLNGLQVGLIEKNKKSILSGDKYFILFEKNEIEKELIIAFTLAYDNFFHKNKGAIFYYDFGNVIIKPDKEIDPNWKPKE